MSDEMALRGIVTVSQPCQVVLVEVRLLQELRIL
jgi:hypothetical protein